MNRIPIGILICGVLSAQAGCNRVVGNGTGGDETEEDSAGDGEGDTSSTDTDSDTGGDETDTGTGTGECEEPNQECSGECVDVQFDNMNCGECGRECLVDPYTDSGVCVNGSCSPTYMECFGEAAGFANCDEYCGSIGEQCDVAVCDGSYFAYDETDADDCYSISHGVGVQATCDTAINFGGPLTPETTIDLARCCCTQSQ